MARSLRYVVTGPGVNPEASYEEVGQALSRSITYAERSEDEGTWYVLDAVSDKTLGYTEVTIQDGVRKTITVRH